MLGRLRQIQARSQIPAWARISRMPGKAAQASTACRPSAGIPRPAWHEHGQAPLVGQGEHVRSAGWSSVKRSARGWSLIPRAPARQAALGLGERVVLRVEPAERHEHASR